MMRPESPRYDALRARLAATCAAKHGRKIELARFLGVRPHQVSEWLSGKEPRAEYALGILEWIAAVEREED